MNERIKELYITAMREDCGEKWDTQEEFIERFAELIVRECAAVANINSHQWQIPGDFVLKHFGINK
jgi:hypothetical protein